MHALANLNCLHLVVVTVVVGMGREQMKLQAGAGSLLCVYGMGHWSLVDLCQDPTLGLVK